MPEPQFPSSLKAYFATNRSLRAGRFGNGFYTGDPRLFRVGDVALERQPDGTWRAGTLTVYAERSRAAATDARAEREWTLLGSDRGFANMRASGIAGETSDILVFLHGAGHSLDSAAGVLGRMAELYSDADRPVCPFFFSYPSNGSSDPLNYFADRDDAELSGVAMARAFGRLISFLARKKLEERCRQRVHLIAHSLGNFALRQAVATVFSNPAYRRLRLFDTVILAHADDDEDTLANREKMRNLSRLADEIVIYYDRTDKLMRLSDAVHMDRLGQKGPNPFPGPLLNRCRLSAIDCAGVDFDLAEDPQRHRHYISSSAVVADIRAVLRAETPPGRVPVAGREGFYRLA